MSVLTGKQLRDLLNAPLDQRLVICPLLDHLDQVRDNQASVDVRLGFHFALISPSSYGVVDELDEHAQVRHKLTRLYRREYVPFGRSLMIHPHQFILAETLEYIRLPGTVAAYVIGRSTWGRLGLIVATAVGIHPGFSGTLTLELRNLGETPLALYPGQTIAQLFFHNAEPSISQNETPGQYSGHTELLPKRFSNEQNYKILLALKREAEKS
jgi:dCTP deaminase